MTCECVCVSRKTARRAIAALFSFLAHLKGKLQDLLGVNSFGMSRDHDLFI